MSARIAAAGFAGGLLLLALFWWRPWDDAEQTDPNVPHERAVSANDRPSPTVPPRRAAVLAIRPGRSVALNLERAGSLELELVAGLPAPVSISVVAAWPVKGSEPGAQLHTLEKDGTLRLPMADGARSVLLHNPGREAIHVLATAAGETRRHLGPDVVRLPATTLGREQPPLRFAVTGDRALKLHVRAVLEGAGDIRSRGFKVEAIGEGSTVLAVQDAWLTPSLARFESLAEAGQGDAAHPLSEPWSGTLSLPKGARFVQLSSEEALLVRAFAHGGPSVALPGAVTRAANRVWRHRAEDLAPWSSTRPERAAALEAAGRQVLVRAQVRLQAVVDPGFAAGPLGDGWRPMETVDPAKTQSLLFPVVGQAPAGRPLWLRCAPGGRAELALLVDVEAPTSGYLEAEVVRPRGANGELHVRADLAGKPAIDDKLVGQRGTFRRGGLARRGAFRWRAEGVPKGAILLARVAPGTVPGTGCTLLTNMGALSLLPGATGRLRFDVPVRNVSGLYLVAYAAQGGHLEVRVDGGTPKRRPGLVFASATEAIQRFSPSTRVGGTRGWQVHRPFASVRQCDRVFVPLREDLQPGGHELHVVNVGPAAVWVQASQRAHAALD